MFFFGHNAYACVVKRIDFDMFPFPKWQYIRRPKGLLFSVILENFGGSTSLVFLVLIIVQVDRYLWKEIVTTVNTLLSRSATRYLPFVLTCTVSKTLPMCFSFPL